MNYETVFEELNSYANPEKKEILQSFFKTGKGEYGEGYIFLGVKVPETRSVAKKNICLDEKNMTRLLKSEIHECRLCALLILIEKFQKSDEKQKKDIVNYYLEHRQYVNNWDLVDLTAPKIIGEFLLKQKDRSILYQLAKSESFWDRRIAIVATHSFIRREIFEDTLRISEILLYDTHDLIHKAVGWMLREVGKRNQQIEENFLKKYYSSMPRTMLRYAIERFDSETKKFYMKK